MASQWTEYRFEGFEDHDDPTKYENQVREQGKYTATVWALHLVVSKALLPWTLEAFNDLAALRGLRLTYEYHYDEDTEQLTVYYNAMSPSTALIVGRALAAQAMRKFYTITPAGDFNEVLATTFGEEEENDSG